MGVVGEHVLQCGAQGLLHGQVARLAELVGNLLVAVGLETHLVGETHVLAAVGQVLVDGVAAHQGSRSQQHRRQNAMCLREKH